MEYFQLKGSGTFSKQMIDGLRLRSIFPKPDVLHMGWIPTPLFLFCQLKSKQGRDPDKGRPQLRTIHLVTTHCNWSVQL